MQNQVLESSMTKKEGPEDCSNEKSYRGSIWRQPSKRVSYVPHCPQSVEAKYRSSEQHWLW
jgi:hypothetical protein